MKDKIYFSFKDVKSNLIIRITVSDDDCLRTSHSHFSTFDYVKLKEPIKSRKSFYLPSVMILLLQLKFCLA